MLSYWWLLSVVCNSISCSVFCDFLIRKTKIIVKMMIEITKINPIINPTINPIEIDAEELFTPFGFIVIPFEFEFVVI